MKTWWKNGITSVILRVFIPDTTSVLGGGKTGLTNNSSGLIISTIADTESSATTYAQASGNIETIATLGMFAAPSAGKCRFKEVDSSNFPGVYEIQIADARWAVSGARSLLIALPAVSGLASGYVRAEVQLTAFDPQIATPSVNVTQWLGQAVAAAVNGIPKVDVSYMLGTVLTEGAAGRLAAALIKFFNVANSTLTTAGVDQTGDSYARIGAPVGASISADIAALGTKLLKYAQLMLRKDAAIATDNATEVTAINADGGSGAGGFDNTTDSQEALADATTSVDLTPVLDQLDDIQANTDRIGAGVVFVRSSVDPEGNAFIGIGKDYTGAYKLRYTSDTQRDLLAPGVVVKLEWTQVNTQRSYAADSITGAPGGWIIDIPIPYTATSTFKAGNYPGELAAYENGVEKPEIGSGFMVNVEKNP